MTKEQILNQFESNREYSSYYHESHIEQAMDQFAKQEAIEFVEWVAKEGYTLNMVVDKFNRIIRKGATRNAEYKTTAELYDLFKNK